MIPSQIARVCLDFVIREGDGPPYILLSNAGIHRRQNQHRLHDLDWDKVSAANEVAHHNYECRLDYAFEDDFDEGHYPFVPVDGPYVVGLPSIDDDFSTIILGTVSFGNGINHKRDSAVDYPVEYKVEDWLQYGYSDGVRV